MARRWLGVFAALAALSAGVGTPPAVADGLPVLGVDVGNTGVETPDGVYRYVTLPARSATVLARVAQDGGRVLERRTLSGSFTIPAVAYDGSADGLSADGSTLVLIAPRSGFPQTRTTLAVVDTGRLLVRATVRLAGDFSFDAISPGGATLYLVQYASADPTDYRVRAYDLPSGRLAAAPIVDPTEPDERMGGEPMTRAWSPDRRWAYTLYRRPSGRPFVHALDTVGHTARCIDLDDLRGDISTTRFDVSPDGDSVTLVRSAEKVATIDTATFDVAMPALPDSNGRPGWIFAAIGGGAGLSLVAALMLARAPRTSHAGATRDLRDSHGPQAAEDLNPVPGEDPAP